MNKEQPDTIDDRVEEAGERPGRVLVTRAGTGGSNNLNSIDNINTQTWATNNSCAPGGATNSSGGTCATIKPFILTF